MSYPIPDDITPEHRARIVENRHRAAESAANPKMVTLPAHLVTGVLHWTHHIVAGPMVYGDVTMVSSYSLAQLESYCEEIAAIVALDGDRAGEEGGG